MNAPDYTAHLHELPALLAEAERHMADLRDLRDGAIADAAAGVPAGLPLAESLQRDFIGPWEDVQALARALGADV